MKKVTIFSIGSCNANTRQGYSRTLLECEGKDKYLTNYYYDTTANRCIIYGMINGVNQINKPCHVVFVSAAPIGVKKAEQGKGVNQDLYRILMMNLEEKKCTWEFDVWSSNVEELKEKFKNDRQFIHIKI